MNKIKYFLIFLLLYSCQEIKKQDDVKTPVDLFKQDLKNKPKYFLNFWEDMTEDEYYKVCSSLVEDGKFDVFNHYLIGNDKIDYEPIIEDYNKDKIIGIRLKNIDKKFYGLFQEKYKLPPLVEKSNIAKVYIETNPLYAKAIMEDFYAKGDFIRDLKVSDFLEMYNKSPRSYSSFYLDEPMDFNIETKKANIKVNETDYTQIGSSKLSLPSNGDKYFETAIQVYFFKSEPYFEALEFKDWRISKERIIVILENRRINIDFYPPDYWNKKIKSEKTKRDMNRETRQKRLDQVKEEI